MHNEISHNGILYTFDTRKCQKTGQNFVVLPDGKNTIFHIAMQGGVRNAVISGVIVTGFTLVGQEELTEGSNVIAAKLKTSF